MADWKVYDGSDDQIAEMQSSSNGFVLRYSNGSQTETFKRIGSSYIGEYIDSRRRMLSGDNLKEVLFKHKISNYLICEPHPLADMICQQARTGQPVWIKVVNYIVSTGTHQIEIYKTLTPTWHSPNAEYSFTPFED